jgi:hypothetical protein
MRAPESPPHMHTALGPRHTRPCVMDAPVPRTRLPAAEPHCSRGCDAPVRRLHGFVLQAAYVGKHHDSPLPAASSRLLLGLLADLLDLLLAFLRTQLSQRSVHKRDVGVVGRRRAARGLGLRDGARDLPRVGRHLSAGRAHDGPLLAGSRRAPPVGTPAPRTHELVRIAGQGTPSSGGFTQDPAPFSQPPYLALLLDLLLDLHYRVGAHVRCLRHRRGRRLRRLRLACGRDLLLLLLLDYLFDLLLRALRRRLGLLQGLSFEVRDRLRLRPRRLTPVPLALLLLPALRAGSMGAVTTQYP